VLTGRRVAALEYCEPEITAVGGIYVDVTPTEAYADGNLASAKGWPGLAAFMREKLLLRHICDIASALEQTSFRVALRCGGMG
jgi:putative intracellular protease/amidase